MLREIQELGDENEEKFGMIKSEINKKQKQEIDYERYKMEQKLDKQRMKLKKVFENEFEKEQRKIT